MEGGRTEEGVCGYAGMRVMEGGEGGVRFNRYKIPHLEITRALQNIILPQQTLLIQTCSWPLCEHHRALNLQTVLQNVSTWAHQHLVLSTQLQTKYLLKVPVCVLDGGSRESKLQRAHVAGEQTINVSDLW